MMAALLVFCTDVTNSSSSLGRRIIKSSILSRTGFELQIAVYHNKHHKFNAAPPYHRVTVFSLSESLFTGVTGGLLRRGFSSSDTFPLLPLLLQQRRQGLEFVNDSPDFPAHSVTVRRSATLWPQLEPSSCGAAPSLRVTTGRRSRR
jgi:hypothetical protein